MKKGGVRRLVLTAVLAAGVAVILNETVFRIRHVDVEGCVSVPSEAVVTLAGLDGGVSYFFVDEERIASGIGAYRYLVYEGMEKTFPNGLTLHVRERVPVCLFKGNVGLYLMDGEGMILEKTDTAEMSGVMTVTGISVREMRVGTMLNGTNAAQVEAYRQVTAELLAQDAAELFSEFNCADPDNLYLTSRTGYVITLGSAGDIRAKLLTVRGVLEYMDMFAMPRGSMDASVPGSITYTPE